VPKVLTSALNYSFRALKHFDLTPSEIQIAKQVRYGYATNKIAGFGMYLQGQLRLTEKICEERLAWKIKSLISFPSTDWDE